MLLRLLLASELPRVVAPAAAAAAAEGAAGDGAREAATGVRDIVQARVVNVVCVLVVSLRVRCPV